MLQLTLQGTAVDIYSYNLRQRLEICILRALC
jgi:hypothetical protein